LILVDQEKRRSDEEEERKRIFHGEWMKIPDWRVWRAAGNEHRYNIYLEGG
jgi:hypothetical protein